MDEQRAHYHQRIRGHLQTAYLLTDDRIEAVLPRFLESLGNLLADLEKQVCTGRAESICKAGHALKGALLNLGLHDLADKAFTIEKHREFSDPPDCAALVAELKTEIGKMI